jgi:hypothetical protein
MFLLAHCASDWFIGCAFSVVNAETSRPIRSSVGET